MKWQMALESLFICKRIMSIWQCSCGYQKIIRWQPHKNSTLTVSSAVWLSGCPDDLVCLRHGICAVWPLPIAHTPTGTITLVAAVLNVQQNSSAFGYLAQGLAHIFGLKYWKEGCWAYCKYWFSVSPQPTLQFHCDSVTFRLVYKVPPSNRRRTLPPHNK